MTKCPRCGTPGALIVSRVPKQNGAEISYKCPRCMNIWKKMETPQE